MKKPSKEQEQAASKTGCPDAVLSNTYPRIMEYLTTEKWEDGSSRTLSKLGICVQDGLISVALNDGALKQSLYTQAGSLGEAMKLLEKALEAGSGNWRSWKAGKK